MEVDAEIRDDDLREQLERARGSTGYLGLVQALSGIQAERDAKNSISPIKRRRLDAREAIRAQELVDADRHHIHSVLALCGLPYRRPKDEQGDYIRDHLAGETIFLRGVADQSPFDVPRSRRRAIP